MFSGYPAMTACPGVHDTQEQVEGFLPNLIQIFCTMVIGQMN